MRIEGKEGLLQTLELHLHIHPDAIERIVIEGKNRVHIISTPVLEHLVSKREGKSRMYLSSERLGYEVSSVFFLANTVQVLDEHFIRYKEEDEEYLLYALSQTVRNDTVFAFAQNNPLGFSFCHKPTK